MVMVWAPGSLALGWRAEVRMQEHMRMSPCDRHLWKPTCGGCPAVPAKASVGPSRAVRPRRPSKLSRRGAGPRCLEPTSVRHCIAPSHGDMTLSPSDTAGIVYTSLPTPMATLTFHFSYHSDAAKTYGKRNMTRMCLIGDIQKKTLLGSDSSSPSISTAPLDPLSGLWSWRNTRQAPRV